MVTPPAKASPGPQQRVPGTIVKITFPSIGGLVYIRTSWLWVGEQIPQLPTARVEGLPWGTFDIYDFAPVEDSSDKGFAVPITNPVTQRMLQHYKMWPEYPANSRSDTKVIPSVPVLVIDTARWTLTYANHLTARISSSVETADEALAEFRSLIGTTGYEGLDPDLMGVVIANNDGSPTSQQDLIALVDAGLYTGHYDTDPPTTIYSYYAAANVVINLAKLYKDQPALAVKQPTFSFRVYLPIYVKGTPGHQTQQAWDLQGGAYKSTITKDKNGNPTPQADERLDFSPIVQEKAEIIGPGEFSYELQVPQWSFPDTSGGPDGAGAWSDGSYVLVTITFGALKKAPKIEMEFIGDQTGPVRG